jgi:hypothetical protein
LLYEPELFCSHLQLLSGYTSLLSLGIVRLLLLLVAVEVQLEVVVELQVWLVVQVRRPSLCADVHARKRRDPMGLDG